jgi:hypothetical protein
MNFFSTHRAQKRPKKSAHKKPQIRWHLLGLPDPIGRDRASSIEVIRQEVASLAKEYPFALHPVEGKTGVRQKPGAGRSKTQTLRH